MPVIFKLAQEGPPDVRLAALRRWPLWVMSRPYPLLLETAASGQGRRLSQALDSLAALPDKAADAKLEALLDGKTGPQKLVVIELLGRAGSLLRTRSAQTRLGRRQGHTRRGLAALGLTVGQATLPARQTSGQAAVRRRGRRGQNRAEKACLRMPDRERPHVS